MRLISLIVLALFVAACSAVQPTLTPAEFVTPAPSSTGAAADAGDVLRATPVPAGAETDFSATLTAVHDGMATSSSSFETQAGEFEATFSANSAAIQETATAVAGTYQALSTSFAESHTLPTGTIEAFRATTEMSLSLVARPETGTPSPTSKAAGTPTSTASPVSPSTLMPSVLLVSFTGSNTQATNVVALPGGVCVIRFEQEGQGAFEIVALNVDTGEETALLAGDGDGSAAKHFAGGQYVFNVKAKGEWTLAVERAR
jgi:hypothetical protein